jgi:hypothetical protein
MQVPIRFLYIFLKENIVLTGCETWVLSLKEEHRQRVAGRKREEVLGGWRIYCDRNVYNLWH